jgi:WhiB family redox-sensing transcriptional regulator
MITGATTRREPAELTDVELQVRVSGLEARCAGTAVPPDEWFPLVADPVKARRHAQRALALCRACPVRAECLELSLRQWSGPGHHGIWGGTLEHERHALRRQWLAGISVGALLRSVHDDQQGARRKHQGTPRPCRDDWGDR